MTLLLDVCLAASAARSLVQTQTHRWAGGIRFEAEVATLTNSQETWGWKVLVLRKNAMKTDSVCVCKSAHACMQAYVHICDCSCLSVCSFAARHKRCQQGLLTVIIKERMGGYLWELFAPQALYSHFTAEGICLETVAPPQSSILPC